MKIKIKPLSVNQCWKGRRFKTTKYKNYEKILLAKLEPLELPKPPFRVHFRFGFSSKLADWDNPIKPFQDILQKRYNFNDRDVFRAVIDKEIVKKGDEFIEFSIKSIVINK